MHTYKYHLSPPTVCLGFHANSSLFLFPQINSYEVNLMECSFLNVKSRDNYRRAKGVVNNVKSK